MLHKSKGQWKWQNKATYAPEYSLSPVIKAYIEQLLTNKDKDSFGVPQYYCEKQAKIEGHTQYSYDIEIDLDAAHALRIKDLEELLWTFSDNAPKIQDYDFDIIMEEVGEDGVKLHCTNEKERDRYRKDRKAWDKRKKKGYKLFGEIYDTLCW